VCPEPCDEPPSSAFTMSLFGVAGQVDASMWNPRSFGLGFKTLVLVGELYSFEGPCAEPDHCCEKHGEFCWED
jgi:hypothetical protein